MISARFDCRTSGRIARATFFVLAIATCVRYAAAESPSPPNIARVEHHLARGEWEQALQALPASLDPNADAHRPLLLLRAHARFLQAAGQLIRRDHEAGLNTLSSASKDATVARAPHKLTTEITLLRAALHEGRGTARDLAAAEKDRATTARIQDKNTHAKELAPKLLQEARTHLDDHDWDACFRTLPKDLDPEIDAHRPAFRIRVEAYLLKAKAMVERKDVSGALGAADAAVDDARVAAADSNIRIKAYRLRARIFRLRGSRSDVNAAENDERTAERIAKANRDPSGKKHTKQPTPR